jgi:WD40-like Beta Propeller Repeat
MRNTERTSVSLATCVATILSLVAIPIVTRGQTTGTASQPPPLTPFEQVWYSGSGDGTHYRLDFTSPDRCACVRRSVGQSTYTWGTADFTDPATGKLLLYSDGKKVFNGQTHKALYNGTDLNGADISNPVQITPVPGGKRDLFYIFTNSANAVWYSIADLSAQPNLPNGQVTVKNRPLATNTGEAQGMVPHANGQAIWLLVYNTGATVDAYLLDGPSGVVATPVSSPLGMGGSSLYKPSIVRSPDYNTLALSNGYYGIAIAKIDQATGKLSDVKLRVTKNASEVGNSCAFSPDGTKLYYARGSYGYSGTPYQFDLTTDVETQLNPTGGFGGPKLAPDGRIYWTGTGKDALSVVQNPNAPGTEVIFLLNDLYLNGGKGAYNLPAQTTAYTAYSH